MKKIAQLKERWVGRRSATAPHGLPEGNDSAVAPLAMHQETISLEQYKLCERCRILQNDVFPLGNWTVEVDVSHLVGRPHVVELSSLDPDCSYCQQFHNIFKIAKRSEKSLNAVSQLSLDQECFTFGNERASGQFYYLKIRLGIGLTAPYIHLFPPKVDWGLKYSVARYIDSSSADLDMFKAVIHNCWASHTSTCTPSATDPGLLQLIDCRDRRIIPASSNQRYICLSYVWGNHTDGIPTFDRSLPDPVPKTVEDAMFVAIQIGIPFLWVDRYCIDQRKPKEKHNIIRNMDKIYHGAELTIIAAVGEDPYHGLPGIRGTLRKPQYRLKFGSDVYVAAESGREEITGSRWGSRGWTYQEMLLSSRRLVFTETQMYFQCMCGTSIESLSPGLTHLSEASDYGGFCRPPYSEWYNREIYTGLTVRSVRNSLCDVGFEELYRLFPHRNVGGHTGYLNDRLREYYKRQLSFGTDTIDAFLGIVNFYSTSQSTRTKITQFYGVLFSYGNTSERNLPRASFLEGLLWSIRTPNNDHIFGRKVTPYFTPHTFPSWSWASAKAAQPANALVDLLPQPILWQYDYDIYREIEVRAQHRRDGISQVEDLPYQEDDYKHFMPWIDITTWTRPCKVAQLSSGVGVVSLYSQDSTIQDQLALDRAEVHAICLKATGFVDDENAVSISGLLVVETEPGLYRRVVGFSRHFNLRKYKLAKEFEEELQQALGSGDESGDAGKAAKTRRLRQGGWNSPRVLERFVGEPWQRRTMRLI